MQKEKRKKKRKEIKRKKCWLEWLIEYTWAKLVWMETSRKGSNVVMKDQRGGGIEMQCGMELRGGARKMKTNFIFVK